MTNSEIMNVVQSSVWGDLIEQRSRDLLVDYAWRDTGTPIEWDFIKYDYRVKTGSLNVWVMMGPDGQLLNEAFRSREAAVKRLGELPFSGRDLYTIIHMEEVERD